MEHKLFTIKAGEFEGPLDLLLDLIERKKLAISDVSLSEVADGYIDYIRTLQQYPLSYTAHFILTASTLVLIKSISLMPTLALSEEEEASIEELELRLNQYKRIRDLSLKIKADLESSLIIWSTKAKTKIEPRFSPSDEISIESVKDSLSNLLQTLPEGDKLTEKTVEKVMSLQDVVADLTSRIQNNMQLSFSKLTNHKGNMSRTERVNLIVNFLAMLELVKNEIVNVSQDAKFTEITITKSTVETR